MAGSSEEGKGGDKDKGEAGGKKVQKDRKKCFQCKAKVGLLGFECRCAYVFCGVCRYPDKHACGFDFHAHDKARLKLDRAEKDKMEKM